MATEEEWSARPGQVQGAPGEQREWPGLDWEDQTWVPVASWGIGADRNRGAFSYRSAVPSFIAALDPVIPQEAREAVAEATIALARLNGSLDSRLNSFGPVLLRSESAASSQIENLTASARSIFAAELGAPEGRNAQQIVANTAAMTTALTAADDITPEAIRAMHAVLMESSARHTPGRWRTEAVWIGTRSSSPLGAEYVAPHHWRISSLIEDLTVFARRRDVSPLIATAIAHAQFETIHPFSDGNGRTGRALAQAMLRGRGVTRDVAIPVSAGLLADLQGYHRALTAYRDGETAPIIEAFALASLRAVRNVEQLVADLDSIRASWDERLHVRRSSNAWRLLDVLVRRPVLSSAAAAEELGVKQPNVYPPMRALEETGIVTARSVHRMGPFWRSDEILAAIDAFAERAGRRERAGH